jgi:hypothetical protein
MLCGAPPCQGEAKSAQQVAVFHSLVNSYCLVPFFPPTAVADILGDGDEVVLGLVS